MAANRDIVRHAVNVDPDNLIVGWLSHGTDVAVFRRDDPAGPARSLAVRPGSRRTARTFRADAVVSNVPGLHFLLTFADCVPLLFIDPVQEVMGAAHAGWRGTAAGMASAVVAALERGFGSRPEDILTAIGPSIGPCCYEVGDDVPASFRCCGFTPVMCGNRLDLWESTVLQLERVGVRAIEVAGLCTSCHTDRFFSHRAEGGVTGRFALVAGLTA